MTTKEFIRQYNQHFDALHGYATKLCGDRDEALDIVQDAAIKAYKYRNRLESSKRFKSWVHTIVKRTYIDLYTKTTRRRKLLEQAPSGVANPMAKTVKNLGVSKLKLAHLMKRIKDVKEIYKKPFFLYHDGYSYEEIAEKLDVPLGTIKSRIYAAKKKMQSRLKTMRAA